MQSKPPLTDLVALNRFRTRAQKNKGPEMFLHHRAITEVQERLELINRRFTSPVIITGFADLWQNAVPGATVIADTDHLDLEPSGRDLIIHAMGLHWSNDPVGQLVQSRLALQPDGLFLAVFPGGQTLVELRQVFAEAELEITGGISPHVAPMGDIRDLGALLQRAGFALPVADVNILQVTYDSALALMHDLRAMGESNALDARIRKPLRPQVIEHVISGYETHFSQGGRIPATFELITLTGWGPSIDQPKPKKRGSATASLSDILTSRP